MENFMNVNCLLKRLLKRRSGGFVYDLHDLYSIGSVDVFRLSAMYTIEYSL